MKKIMALFLFLCVFICGCQATEITDPVPVYYFQNNPCSTCNERANLNQAILQAGKSDIPYSIVEYKTFSPESTVAVANLRAFIAPEMPNYPLLVVGDTVLVGYEEIQTKFSESLQKYARNSNSHFSPTASISAQTIPEAAVPSPPPRNENYGVLFTTESCMDCEKVKTYLPEIENFTVDIRSVVQTENIALMGNFFEAYQVPTKDQQVPILFLSGTYFSGWEQIHEQLQGAVNEGAGKNFVYPQPRTEKPRLSILATLATGLLNGMNPCALSMLFLLLSVLINMKEKPVCSGLAYLLGKFTAYLGLGLLLALLANSLSLAWLSGLRLVGGVALLLLSLVLAVANFLDFYYASQENYGKIHMQLPKALRKWNSAAIEKISAKKKSWLLLPTLFVLGLIISAGELLCTGQIYLASILYAAQSGTLPVLYLILYVAAMCVPSVIGVILVGAGKRILTLSEFSRKHLPLIKLLNGILFLVFGVLAIFMLV